MNKTKKQRESLFTNGKEPIPFGYPGFLYVDVQSIWIGVISFTSFDPNSFSLTSEQLSLT